MKILKYTDVNATLFDSGPAKKIAARVVIGKDDGANRFYMRVFDLSPPEGIRPSIPMIGNMRCSFTRAKGKSTGTANGIP